MIVVRQNDDHVLFRAGTVTVASVCRNHERAWTNHQIRYRLSGT
jgi:hypothetical protein